MNDNTARKSTAEGSATGNRRKRIRPSRARGLRTKTGCLTCRERRVKCDDGKPTCVRCSKTDRVCRYAQGSDEQRESARTHLEARESRNEEVGAGPSTTKSSSPVQQPIAEAVSTSDPVRPLHAYNSIETLQRHHLPEAIEQELPSFDSAVLASPLPLSHTSPLNISPFEWYDLLARDAITSIQRLNDISSGDPRWQFPEATLSRKQSPAPEHLEAQLNRQSQLSLEHRGDQTDAHLRDQRQLHQPWNTQSRIELSVLDLSFFRYYIEVVGPMLDLFDPKRHFSNVVPHLALRNTGLLKSILAVGAKHMSLGLQEAPARDAPVCTGHAVPNANTPASLSASGLSPEVEPAPVHMATQYYYETLQYLSQTLLYPSYADSHEILATATMISTYEMFDVDSASGNGTWEQHLKGSFWIQRSQDNDGESADGLRQAVWWAWLRQDIWAAFQASRSTITFWRAKKALKDLNADELGIRIIYICGKCVKYAASGETRQNQDPSQRIEEGDQLLRTLDDWYNILPASYQQVNVATGPEINTVFPPIWIHPPNHAGAMQMYHFARATVLLNQPTMGGLKAYILRDKQLNDSVKVVCGIANSCQESEAAIALVNVQALFAVGQFVRSPEERDELIRILNNMLRISKLPAQGLVARLRMIWQE